MSGKNNRWVIGAVAGIILLGLAFPVSNLLAPQVTQVDPAVLTAKGPAFAKVAPILEKKCFACHSSQTVMPFYASFPVAKDLIQQDIQAGLAAFNIESEILSEKPLTESTLAKLELVLHQGSMPPGRYVLMHWDARLSDTDKAAIQAWIQETRTKLALNQMMPEEHRGEPVRPLLANAEINQEKASLGERLFHDTRLSGDNTISCATCHALNKGGTDREAVSTGIRGQKGGINSPTVFNSSYNFVQFWDGRAANLHEQAGGPVTNPIEMGASWDDVLPKLRADAGYRQAFRTLYQSNITPEDVQDAIATFEETLVTVNSPFDRYLMGDTKAISEEAQKGYDLFKSVGCASCHYGAALGGQRFAKMGSMKPYFGKSPSTADLGRFNVTQNPQDKFQFKVPILRNIAQTAPYFHDASARRLEDAVRVMAEVQLGKTLSNQKVSAIVAFLNTLTGEYRGKPVE